MGSFPSDKHTQIPSLVAVVSFWYKGRERSVKVLGVWDSTKEERTNQLKKKMKTKSHNNESSEPRLINWIVAPIA